MTSPSTLDARLAGITRFHRTTRGAAVSDHAELIAALRGLVDDVRAHNATQEVYPLGTNHMERAARTLAQLEDDK